MKKILIVEDNKEIRSLIKNYLVKQGFSVSEAEDGEEGLNIFYRDTFDLVILDIVLPKKDGWRVCREIKKYSTVPVIILTSNTDEEDELFGFEVGANDFMRKPFSLKVLTVRINNLLTSSNHYSCLQIGNLAIDEIAHSVKFNDNLIELTPKEYEFLIFLIKNENKVVSRERILNEVWGFEFFGDTRTIDTHVKSLRKKIDKNLIETVYGIGYRFRVDI